MQETRVWSYILYLDINPSVINTHITVKMLNFITKDIGMYILPLNLEFVFIYAKGYWALDNSQTITGLKLAVIGVTSWHRTPSWISPDALCSDNSFISVHGVNRVCPPPANQSAQMMWVPQHQGLCQQPVDGKSDHMKWMAEILLLREQVILRVMSSSLLPITQSFHHDEICYTNVPNIHP